MNFISENFHQSLKYSQDFSGEYSLLDLQKNINRKFYTGKCYSINQEISKSKINNQKKLDDLLYSSSSIFNGLFDQINKRFQSEILSSVGIYIYIQKENSSSDLFQFNPNTLELVSYFWENKNQKKNRIETLKKSIANGDFIQEAPITLFFTGILDRANPENKRLYRELELSIGALAGFISIFVRSKGGYVIPLGSFIDEDISYSLGLTDNEFPLAAIAIMPKFLKKYETVSQFVYSNRSSIFENQIQSEMSFDYVIQNKAECIDDLSKCVKIFRVQGQSLDGDEFPLASSKYPTEYFFKIFDFLKLNKFSYRPFKQLSFSLECFSTMLRWIDNCSINAFGGGLLHFWIINFDISLMSSGVYRYIPLKKSLFLNKENINKEKFDKTHLIKEHAINTSFAILLTTNLKESCNLMGERAYRCLNLNSGYIVEMLVESAQILGKFAFRESFYKEDSLKTICEIPNDESILCEVLVGC